MPLPTRSNRIDRRLIAETGNIPVGLMLLQDCHPLEIKKIDYTLREGKNKQELPVMVIEGLFQQGDSLNANERWYPANSVLRPAIENIQEDLQARAVLGELDHPTDAKIHLDRVSHLVTGLRMEGKKVWGTAEILYKIPMGAYLRGLFEHKVRVGVSSRGVGDMEIMEHNGRQVHRVQDGYSIITFDIVAEPSVTGAVLNIREGLNRRTKPIRHKRNLLSPERYDALVVEEINKYFSLPAR
jgi:predicted transcriptional regulator